MCVKTILCARKSVHLNIKFVEPCFAISIFSNSYMSFRRFDLGQQPGIFPNHEALVGIKVVRGNSSCCTFSAMLFSIKLVLVIMRNKSKLWNVFCL